MDQDPLLQETPKKGGRLRLVIIALVALAGAGGAAYYFVPTLTGDAKAADSDDAPEKPEKKKKKKGGKKGKGVIDGPMQFDPFILSLPTRGDSYRTPPRMRMTVALELKTGFTATEMKLQLRDAFIEATQNLDQEVLRGPEGVDLLRDELAIAAERLLPGKVERVLITDFILM